MKTNRQTKRNKNGLTNKQTKRQTNGKRDKKRNKRTSEQNFSFSQNELVIKNILLPCKLIRHKPYYKVNLDLFNINNNLEELQ